MPIIQTSLFLVIKRFPGHKHAIRKFFLENEEFKVICDDYCRCCEALERWNQSTSEKASALRKEYADLLGELEGEILHYLNEPA